MLMPVLQTLAKKLNKDVFQEGKERSGVHTERRWAHVSDALQAGEEARTGSLFQKEGGEEEGENSPSIKPDKSKSASSTAASGTRAERSRQRTG